MSEPIPMRLDCGLCLVRDWRTSDRDSLLRFANNRNVWRNMTNRFPHPYTAADADHWFTLLSQTSQPTHWAIEMDDCAVGGIGVDLGGDVYSKSGSFGYWLGEPFWGRGIMTAAVRTTSDYILSSFGLARLESRVFEWNPRSMRVLEKCGFVREGLLRRSVYKDGALIDSVLFAKLA